MKEELARLLAPGMEQDPCEGGSEIVHTDDRLTLDRTTASQNAWACGVQWVRWSEDRAERGIDEILEYFGQRGHPFVWSVGPHSEPSSLGSRLLARGFVHEATARMLGARLPIVGLRTNPDIIVREATDDATMRDSLRIEQATRGKPIDAPLEAAMLEERMSYVSCLGRKRRFAVAYLDGVAISSARWRFRDDRAQIHLSGAETLPEYRNLGAYSTLSAYRTERALERGCRYATIFADQTTSAPILLKRGFIDVGSVDYYVSPELRESRSSTS